MTAFNGSESSLQKVVDGGYCIGCGACAVDDTNNQLIDSPIGIPQAKLDARTASAEVCPFSTTSSEDDIGTDLYSGFSKYDKRVGYHLGNYVGHVIEGEYRAKASSGGMVTWVLAELLRNGHIDGVIHVAEGMDSIFEYQISESVEQITSRAKSRYYPTHYDDALKSILGNGKRYAFVGVPCFVKSIRLLAKHNESVNKSIKFCIAIFCGHMKTKAFAEMIALQQGIEPRQIHSVDFRVKNANLPANRYSSQVICSDRFGERNALPPVATSQLYGLDWGLGYFKPKACDWCDDIAGETADLSCGDAWLPETVGDSAGTNIMIVRDRLINDVIAQGVTNRVVALKEVSVDKVYESQAGNYRHRREGLAVRIGVAKQEGVWAPRKRVQANEFVVPVQREKIYRLRERIAAQSHIRFGEAKQRGSFSYFLVKMLPVELYYYYLNKRLIKGCLKVAYQYAHYLKRKIL
ncbi:MAG TPA: coenzyme F420 hydrogenase [Pseudomonas xinjiangensis]|uniref:Coenzyme F420 hydrogenase n=2 Tax=root TaxID=1 RepID=A0A7V1BRC0_9GAMM|nr:coenzyme F420 hydrogenase [Halopseudomonas xinjiangensis]HEC47466.1 coenzyme F420 hydrogenase [Halopseudomonas xinjiangensis]